MLVATTPLSGLTPENYDLLLSAGWFRGSGVFYTCGLVCMDHSVFGVKQIRYDIDTLVFKKRHRKLLAKNAACFSVAIQPVTDISPAKQLLYAQHKHRFKAFIHEDLNDVVFNGALDTTFEKMEMCVYDGDKLIALSYFDKGENSVASILGLFDENYEKHSLGIYTMLKEIEYCQQQEYHYYYPGYVLEDNTDFDYKLQFGTVQWRTKDGDWDEEARAYTTIARELKEKIAQLKVLLSLNEIVAEKKIYTHYGIGYLAPKNIGLVKYPIYFQWHHGADLYAASYDLERQRFIIFQLIIKKNQLVNHMQISDDYINDQVYEHSIGTVCNAIYFDDFVGFREALKNLQLAHIAYDF
jgi:leucyl-tRNA---protein transferase